LISEYQQNVRYFLQNKNKKEKEKSKFKLFPFRAFVQQF